MNSKLLLLLMYSASIFRWHGPFPGSACNSTGKLFSVNVYNTYTSTFTGKKQKTKPKIMLFMHY